MITYEDKMIEMDFKKIEVLNISYIHTVRNIKRKNMQNFSIMFSIFFFILTIVISLIGLHFFSLISITGMILSIFYIISFSDHISIKENIIYEQEWIKK
jgi:hypothetical protein